MSSRASESVEDLWADDTFDGRIGIVDPSAPSVDILFWTLGERYPELFEQLGELNPRVFANAGAVSEAMAAGEVDVALNVTQGIVEPENVEFSYEERFPAPANPVYGAALGCAESPNAAQLFMNWMLSPEGQEVVGLGYGTILPDVSTATISSSDVEIMYETPENTPLIEAAVEELNASLGR